MDSIENDIVRLQEERKKKEQEGATALTSVTFDSDLYGSGNRFEGYEQSIAVTEEDEEQNFGEHEIARKLASYTAPKSIIKELPKGADDDDFGSKKSQKIIDREDDYRKRRLNRIISPDRNDAFAMGDKTPDVSMRTYADVMKEEYLKRQKEETLREIAKKKKEEEEKKASEREMEAGSAPAQTTSKRRNRWDQSQEQESNKKVKTTSGGSDWDVPDSTPGIGRWDATPTPGRVAADATPSVSSMVAQIGRFNSDGRRSALKNMINRLIQADSDRFEPISSGGGEAARVAMDDWREGQQWRGEDGAAKAAIGL